jgi:hypothetical protein
MSALILTFVFRCSGLPPSPPPESVNPFVSVWSAPWTAKLCLVVYFVLTYQMAAYEMLVRACHMFHLAHRGQKTETTTELSSLTRIVFCFCR